MAKIFRYFRSHLLVRVRRSEFKIKLVTLTNSTWQNHNFLEHGEFKDLTGNTNYHVNMVRWISGILGNGCSNFCGIQDWDFTIFVVNIRS